MVENPVLTFFVMIAAIIFLVIACAFVYLTTPNKFRFFDLPVSYYHRGIYNNKDVPENSLTAFYKSAESGIGVELDVQPTKDGKVVVIHDFNAKRLTGVDRLIREMTYEEVSELKLLDTEEKIPLFTEVLEACGEIPVSCEIKTPGAEVNPEFLENVYQIIKDYKGSYNVISFNPYVLEWFKKNHPEVIRGQLSAGKNDLGVKGFGAFALSNLLTNYIAKPDFISYHLGDKSLGFLLCRHYGTRLCCWTVRSMEDVEKAAYDGYSTFVGENFDMNEV